MKRLSVILLVFIFACRAPSRTVMQAGNERCVVLLNLSPVAQQVVEDTLILGRVRGTYIRDSGKLWLSPRVGAIDPAAVPWSYWFPLGDSVEMGWSDGLVAVFINGRLSEQQFRGRMRYYSDAVPPDSVLTYDIEGLARVCTARVTP